MSAHRRKAMLRTLTLSLIEEGAIRTTPARAKELRWFADRVVTLAKRGDLHSRRRLVQILGSTQTYRPGENRVRKAMDELYTTLVPRFKDRPGGYTQLIRLAGRRPGDNAEMCMFRYLPDPNAEKGKKDKAAKKPAKPTKKLKTKAATAEDKPAKGKAKEDTKSKKSKEKKDQD